MVGHYSWEAPVKLHVPEALFGAVVSILRSVSRSDCVVPILPPSLSIPSPSFSESFLCPCVFCPLIFEHKVLHCHSGSV